MVSASSFCIALRYDPFGEGHESKPVIGNPLFLCTTRQTSMQTGPITGTVGFQVVVKDDRITLLNTDTVTGSSWFITIVSSHEDSMLIWLERGTRRYCF
jgi:hypothetical protein